MPNDLFLLPITNLRALAAASARWQTLTGSASAAQAADRIYKNSARGIEDHPRPRMIVGTAGNRSLVKQTSTSWFMEAPLFLEVEIETPEELIGDHNAAHDWFLGEIETIIEEMAALAGSAGYLDVNQFNEVEPPLPFDEPLNDEREYWGTVYEVQYAAQF